MVSENLPESLIDLVYRDPHRIPSLSAQLFSGLLKSTESSSADRAGRDIVVGGGIASLFALKGERKTASESSSLVKDIHEPGDILAVNVLATLAERGWIDAHYNTATNAAIISAKGTLLLSDPILFQTAFAYATDMELDKRKKKEMSTLSNMVTKLKLPPMFYLQDNSGALFYGLLDNAGLVEPVDAFCLKHGSGGLDDVTVVGVHETVGRGIFNGPEITRVMAEASSKLAALFAPESAVKISPICIYRTLSKARSPT